MEEVEKNKEEQGDWTDAYLKGEAFREGDKWRLQKDKPQARKPGRYPAME